MARNIVIFSDGTGQAGGLLPDERRSNIYKLFRAARCGPDTAVDPDLQLTFYDPGLGSAADGERFKIGFARRIYNFLAQATGLGITSNIVQCYAAIVQMWQPGDRIYLFGFSRGAYTARCVAGVIGLCGVPTQMKDGSPLRRDPVSALAIAKEAVRSVYQHGAGRRPRKDPRGDELEDQRIELAGRFRRRYRSSDAEIPAQSNAIPYFIGVFDTVATLGISALHLALLLAAVFVLVVLAGWLCLRLLDLPWTIGQFALGSFALITFAAAAAYAFTHIKWASGLSVPLYKTIHMTRLKMRFYDTRLNPRVAFAKHALAIDENRRDFDRVAWTDSEGTERKEEGWFEQIWFAGVHSDIGGSYPENESRLSDITLDWMVGRATSTPYPLVVDRRWLNLFPSACGMQHDERKSALFRLPLGLRRIPADAALHPTVQERFRCKEVLHYDVMGPYRPPSLRNHEDAPHPYV